MDRPLPPVAEIDIPLFDLPPGAQITIPPRLADNAPLTTAGERRRARHATLFARGIHPLTLFPLHPDAPPYDQLDRPGPRCGLCAHRILLDHHNRKYPKCLYPDTEPNYSRDYQFFSHSEATDVRAWWPACDRWKPGPRALTEPLDP